MEELEELRKRLEEERRLRKEEQRLRQDAEALARNEQRLREEGQRLHEEERRLSEDAELRVLEDRRDTAAVVAALEREREELMSARLGMRMSACSYAASCLLTD